MPDGGGQLGEDDDREARRIRRARRRARRGEPINAPRQDLTVPTTEPAPASETGQAPPSPEPPEPVPSLATAAVRRVVVKHVAKAGLPGAEVADESSAAILARLPLNPDGSRTPVKRIVVSRQPLRPPVVPELSPSASSTPTSSGTQTSGESDVPADAPEPDLPAGPRPEAGLADVPGESPPPAAKPTTRKRRRWFANLWLGLAAVLLFVLIVVMLSKLTSTSADSSSDDGGPTVAPTARATPTESVGPVSSADDGVTAEARVVDGQTITVTEVAHWPGGPPAQIQLRLLDLSSAAGLTVSLDASVTNLEATLDGQTVAVSPSGVDDGTWSISTPGGTTASTLELTYQLHGAVVLSTPSSPGRALAVLAPLSAGAVGSMPVRVRISDAGVLSLSCPTAPTIDASLCGRHHDGEWEAEAPPGGAAIVLAQINLA